MCLTSLSLEPKPEILSDHEPIQESLPMIVKCNLAFVWSIVFLKFQLQASVN